MDGEPAGRDGRKRSSEVHERTVRAEDLVVVLAVEVGGGPACSVWGSGSGNRAGSQGSPQPQPASCCAASSQADAAPAACAMLGSNRVLISRGAALQQPAQQGITVMTHLPMTSGNQKRCRQGGTVSQAAWERTGGRLQHTCLKLRHAFHTPGDAAIVSAGANSSNCLLSSICPCNTAGTKLTQTTGHQMQQSDRQQSHTLSPAGAGFGLVGRNLLAGVLRVYLGINIDNACSRDRCR